MGKRIRSLYALVSTPKRTIELAVALLIFILLLIVSIPQFKQAQVHERYAIALNDLQTVSKAMSLFNQNADLKQMGLYYSTTDRPASVIVDGVKAELREGSDSYSMTFGTHTNLFSVDELKPYLGELPLPPERYVLPERKEARGHYFVMSYQWREFVFDMNSRRSPNSPTVMFILSMHGITANPNIHRFEQNPPRQWIGVYHGPFLDSRLSHQEGFHVSYDPTNGVWSHGFTVYQSPEGGVISKQAFELQLAKRNPVARKAWIDMYGRRRAFAELKMIYQNIPKPSTEAFNELKDSLLEKWKNPDLEAITIPTPKSLMNY